MNKNFTFEDLIRYAYNETGFIESVKIRQAIDENPELCENYVQLVNTMHVMDSLLKEPSEKSVENILEYSKSLVTTVAW
jgi:hypothetical protein